MFWGQRSIMDAVGDYLLSLPGGLLNPTYTLDAATNFIMDHRDIYLKKLFPHYSFELIKGLIRFLCPAINPLQAVCNHITAANACCFLAYIPDFNSRAGAGNWPLAFSNAIKHNNLNAMNVYGVQTLDRLTVCVVYNADDQSRCTPEYFQALLRETYCARSASRSLQIEDITVLDISNTVGGSHMKEWLLIALSVIGFRRCTANNPVPANARRGDVGGPDFRTLVRILWRQFDNVFKWILHKRALNKLEGQGREWSDLQKMQSVQSTLNEWALKHGGPNAVPYSTRQYQEFVQRHSGVQLANSGKCCYNTFMFIFKTSRGIGPDIVKRAFDADETKQTFPFCGYMQMDTSGVHAALVVFRYHFPLQGVSDFLADRLTFGKIIACIPIDPTTEKDSILAVFAKGGAAHSAPFDPSIYAVFKSKIRDVAFVRPPAGYRLNFLAPFLVKDLHASKKTGDDTACGGKLAADQVKAFSTAIEQQEAANQRASGIGSVRNLMVVVPVASPVVPGSCVADAICVKADPVPFKSLGAIANLVPGVWSCPDKPSPSRPTLKALKEQAVRGVPYDVVARMAADSTVARLVSCSPMAPASAVVQAAPVSIVAPVSTVFGKCGPRQQSRKTFGSAARKQMLVSLALNHRRTSVKIYELFWSKFHAEYYPHCGENSANPVLPTLVNCFKNMKERNFFSTTIDERFMVYDVTLFYQRVFNSKTFKNFAKTEVRELAIENARALGSDARCDISELLAMDEDEPVSTGEDVSPVEKSDEPAFQAVADEDEAVNEPGPVSATDFQAVNEPGPDSATDFQAVTGEDEAVAPAIDEPESVAPAIDEPESVAPAIDEPQPEDPAIDQAKSVYAIDFQAVADGDKAMDQAGPVDQEDKKRKLEECAATLTDGVKKLKRSIEFISGLLKLHEDRREPGDVNFKTEEMFFKSVSAELPLLSSLCKATCTAAIHGDMVKQELEDGELSPTY